jgi:hypothetical protein
LKKASRKSQVDFYVDLVVQTIRSDPSHITSKKDLQRDIETVRSRCNDEGLSFLTKTLPSLGKALDQGLVSGRFNIPLGFKHSHKNASIPAFLQAYFNRLFSQDGVLLDESDASDVNHLRQVLMFAYKLDLPYTAAQESVVIQNFIATELDLEFTDNVYTKRVLDLASSIVGDIFEDFDPKDIKPRHGPGAVATGERLEEKWDFSRLYSDIHSVFPYYDYFVVGGGREILDRKDWYMSLERLDHGRAKVILVPKDSRGPRLISCEPLEYQWIQQGLGRKIMSHLESFKLTRGRINFTNQEINRKLALDGSNHQGIATLDLKDASDRVSLALVERLFERTPSLLRALKACRTTETTLPDGSVVTLNKFAPMGSALCFPIEAVCFWALLVSACSIRWRLPLRMVGERIFVYGDDLIVPTDWAPQCIQSLEMFALKVNKSKCCITGQFRESCGMDAFKGVQVTPTRLRHQWTGKPTDGTVYYAYVALLNSMRSKNYALVAERIEAELAKTYGPTPYGLPNSPFPCIQVTEPEIAIDYNKSKFPYRWHRHYQRVEFRVPAIQTRKLDSSLDGWPRLLRDVVSPVVGDPSVVVVPRSTRLKRGWMPV